ncbi:hypothetical protein NQ314_007290 [Rhamnusium bicolor]|uniref:Saposin B-type domain-containing protein n=1 Tax=Rhamnusium bicolor TaxID=1586634 RepID=A0AAV8YPP5_9CUCU|nr:hypothetical protein NQ314_007290 [Rhamnusium bicolor]
MNLMDLYLNNMMANALNEKTTLDGCLCYSKDFAAYQTCMTLVRQNMTDQLMTILITNFISIVETDCNTLILQNCVPE